MRSWSFVFFASLVLAGLQTLALPFYRQNEPILVDELLPRAPNDRLDRLKRRLKSKEAKRKEMIEESARWQKLAGEIARQGGTSGSPPKLDPALQRAYLMDRVNAPKPGPRPGVVTVTKPLPGRDYTSLGPTTPDYSRSMDRSGSTDPPLAPVRRSSEVTVLPPGKKPNTGGIVTQPNSSPFTPLRKISGPAADSPLDQGNSGLANQKFRAPGRQDTGTNVRFFPDTRPIQEEPEQYTDTSAPDSTSRKGSKDPKRPLDQSWQKSRSDTPLPTTPLENSPRPPVPPKDDGSGRKPSLGALILGRQNTAERQLGLASAHRKDSAPPLPPAGPRLPTPSRLQTSASSAGGGRQNSAGQAAHTVPRRQETTDKRAEPESKKNVTPPPAPAGRHQPSGPRTPAGGDRQNSAGQATPPVPGRMDTGDRRAEPESRKHTTPSPAPAGPHTPAGGDGQDSAGQSSRGPRPKPGRDSTADKNGSLRKDSATSSSGPAGPRPQPQKQHSKKSSRS